MRWLQALGLCFVLALFSRTVIGADAPPFGVPDEDSVNRATKSIKETFRAEYAAAQTVPQRAALAQRFLKEAQDTKDDSVSQYVLLCEAREWAAKGADGPTALQAVELLSKLYGVPPGEMALAALSNASHFAAGPVTLEPLTRAAMAAADAALLRDEFDIASRLAALAESSAQKSKKVSLLSEAQEKVKEVNWVAQQYTQSKAAIETLSLKPNDASAKSAAGRFKCLVKNDWDHGLALLREGVDAQLKTLAEKDLVAQTADAALQHEIGDQWWDLGETLLGRARQCCRNRAAYWYRKAVAKLAGISKTRTEKRLEEFDIAYLREMHLEPGLYCEFFEGQKFEKRLDHRTDTAIDFTWEGAPAEGLPKDDFSVRWTGFLRTPTTGKYTFLIFLNEGGRLEIDDKVVFDESKGTSKRKGFTATVPLTEGMHKFKLDFWDGGGIAKVRLLWTPPGGNEEVIGGKAYVKEIGK